MEILRNDEVVGGINLADTARVSWNENLECEGRWVQISTGKATQRFASIDVRFSPSDIFTLYNGLIKQLKKRSTKLDQLEKKFARQQARRRATP